MIGVLPKSLNVDGVDYEINSDFRIALLIFEAFNDPDLMLSSQIEICLKCLYKTLPNDLGKAVERAYWFLDGGDMPKSKQAPAKLMDWKQDESLIFPAINKVAGYETRATEYLHWWSFLGMFNEIGDGLYSQVMSIRSKRARHKRLQPWEKEFYKEHTELIDIKQALSATEKAEFDEEADFINSLV